LLFACQDSNPIFGLDSKLFSPLANQGQWAFFMANFNLKGGVR